MLLYYNIFNKTILFFFFFSDKNIFKLLWLFSNIGKDTAVNVQDLSVDKI